MIAVSKTIDPLLKQTNAPRKRFLIGIFPSLTSLDPSLFNALRIPRPLISLERTIRIISAIEKAVIIMIFEYPDL